jgi:16S rRNA G966 N2-methylase RsmD
VDAHYTPLWLAETVVSHARRGRPRLVADLAAGEGSLLSEAAIRWPSARLLATDINAESVRRLQKKGQRWAVGRCDLLSPKSRRACRKLQDARGKVSLLLLNPPFSCRGGTRHTVLTSAGPVRASSAMAFLLVGLQYLAKTGHAIAILPAGSVYNKKDKEAWQYIRSRFVIRRLGKWGKKTFPGCAASSVLVRLIPCAQATRKAASSQARRARTTATATILRGTCPVHALPMTCDGPTLVHSSDLKDSKVVLNGHRGFGTHRCLSGPAVLIPRVGRLTPEKIAIFKAHRRIMISDCVIALLARSPGAAAKLQRLLLRRFQTLSNQYVGTGAPHITLTRLQDTLDRIGVSSN